MNRVNVRFRPIADIRRLCDAVCMKSALTISAAVLFIVIFDNWAKGQAAALASHYAKLPVYEMIELFRKDRRLKLRLLPLAMLVVLAACLVFEALSLPVLAIAVTVAVLAYCWLLFKGWMRLIRSA